MRYPQVVILEADGWIAQHLRALAVENRWLVKEPRRRDDALSLAREGRPTESASASLQRQIRHALSLAREGRPTVLLVQVEPAEDRPEPLALIADAHRLAPDVPVVAVSDVKLPDAERAAWTAALMDLGARYVLFPPLAKPVLEDVVSGLMAVAVARTGGAAPAEDVIDLADEGTQG